MLGRDKFGLDYQYFNVHYLDWKRPVYRLWWFIRVVLEIIIPIRLPRKSKILSIGAGLGQPEYILKKYFGYDVYMTDISSYAKELNQKLFGKTNYTVTTATKLPFSDNSFDLILSYDLLEHLKNEKELEDALSEMKRVLKKGKGINMFHKTTVLEEKEINMDDTHNIKWPSEKWKEWFKTSGLKVVRQTSHYIPVWSNRRISFSKVLGAYYLSFCKN